MDGGLDVGYFLDLRLEPCNRTMSVGLDQCLDEESIGRANGCGF